jgi:hypothetical protein
MAFKHIQSNRLVFLLSEEGTPSGVVLQGENIPNGSLCVDTDNGKLFILSAGVWKEVGTDQTPIVDVPEYIVIRETPIVPAGTSGYVFPIGTGTAPVIPLDNTLYFYVNTMKSIIDVDWEYNTNSQEITWISPRYDLEATDEIEIFYTIKILP